VCEPLPDLRSGIVVGYEVAAALTDFVINVIFERSFETQIEHRSDVRPFGWTVSGTALLSQLVLVPLLLSMKRVALFVPR
jgi:hypothetical protein